VLEETVDAWLRDNAVPIRSVEPGDTLDDLRPVGVMIGDARVVGLGESAHGVREFTTL
jgi:erythromycin esterase